MTNRIASGSALVLISVGLTGCAGLVPTPQPAAPAAPPAAAAGAAEPCPFISQAQVSQLAGDQRNQLSGSVNACSFNIGGKFTYQINVFANDNDRFQSERDRLYKNSTDVNGIGDEAFFRDGTAITTLGVREGNTYFTVNLVPAVADPDGGAGGAPVAPVRDPGAAALQEADVNDDGVVDADLDEDGVIDDDADPAAVAAADADGDGQVDAAIVAALGNGDEDARVRAAAGPIDNIADAKARMTEIALTVSESI